MIMKIAGIYPMLYAFYEGSGALSRGAFARQVEAAAAAGADGIAVLGLGTEVGKLSLSERRLVVDWVLAEVAGRLPVAVTIADGNMPDMSEAARHAEAAGAAWLILQPPRPPASGADLVTFFATVAEATRLPVAIQNAPEFLGIGLTAAELIALHELAPNVVAVKGEASATVIARMIAALGSRMPVLNGRAGLELTDNYRAGVAGMIPGIETVDRQVAIARAMLAGEHDRADALYAGVLPVLTFIMQSLSSFLTYGKLIAALRLGIDPGPARVPSEPPTEQGLAWAQRMADRLGPLPT
jgi:4-hydroxy-tetrahydrodipicolinate synthase